MAFFFVFTLVGCSRSEQRKLVIDEEVIPACKKVFEKSLNDRNLQFHLDMKNGLSHSLSYTVTGLGYLGDTVLFATNGILMPIITCAPLSPVASRAARGAELMIRCWIHVSHFTYTSFKKELGGSFGKQVYKSTEPLRCPDLEWLITAVRKTANCYHLAGRNDLYLKQMAVLEEEETIKKCL